MEDLDPKKRTDIEKLSPHEYALHKERVRDNVSSLSTTGQKFIDRYMLASHAASYLDIGGHVRLVAAFDKEFGPYVPANIRDGLMESARKVYDAVRKDWLLVLTKVKDGVMPAEQFYTSTTPGMTTKEASAYKKMLKNSKRQNGGGQGGTPKKGRFGRGGSFDGGRGGGRRGREYYGEEGGYGGYEDNRGNGQYGGHGGFGRGGRGGYRGSNYGRGGANHTENRGAFGGNQNGGPNN